MNNTDYADASLIAQIRQHALRNYETDGWDYLVECWSDAEILEKVKDCRSYNGCIKKLHGTLKSMNEYRREIVATGEW